MDTLYKCAVDPVDRARIERLEVFDEFEEWHMIQVRVGAGSTWSCFAALCWNHLLEHALCSTPVCGWV